MNHSSSPIATFFFSRHHINPTWNFSASIIDDSIAAVAYNSTASMNWSSFIDDLMEDDDATDDPLSGFPYPSLYSWAHIVGASIAVTVVMLSIIFGNGLVVVAIVVDRGLRGLQNWFVASLAISDLLVGMFIMPLTLTNELVGYWPFGNAICELWLSTDVLLCTASILNLCLISLDRYWSIIQPIAYVRWRTPKRSAAMISVVWVLSMVICLPPLVGWKRPQPTKHGRYPLCVLSEEPGYIIYSSIGSFYLPLVVMVLVYFKIYLAARDRARRNLKTKVKQKKQPSMTVVSSSSPVRVVSKTTRSIIVMEETELERASSRNNFDGRVVSKTTRSIIVMEEVERASSRNNFDGRVVSKTTRSIIVMEETEFERASSRNNFDGRVVSKTTRSNIVMEETELERASSRNNFDGRVVSKTTRSNIVMEETELERASSRNNFDGRVVSKTTRSIIVMEEVERASSRNNFDGRVVSKTTRSVIVMEETEVEIASSRNKFDGGRERSALICQHATALEPDSMIESDEDENDDVVENVFDKPENGAFDQFADDVAQPLSDEITQSSSDVVSAVNFQLNAATNSTITCTNEETFDGLHQLTIEYLFLSTENRNEGKADRQEDFSETVVEPHVGCSDEVATPEVHDEPGRRMTLLNSPPVDTSIKSDRRKASDCFRSDRLLSVKSKQRRSFVVVNSCPSSKKCDGNTARRSSSLLPAMKNYFLSSATDRGASDSKKRHRSVDLTASSIPDPERKKRKLARARERRATLVLGIVMASFIGCWLPFFAIYPATVLSGTEVSSSLFAVIFWLGYCNSALNPIIYTIFNRDFRVAFARILFCGEWRRRRGANQRR